MWWSASRCSDGDIDSVGEGDDGSFGFEERKKGKDSEIRRFGCEFENVWRDCGCGCDETRAVLIR